MNSGPKGREQRNPIQEAWTQLSGPLGSFLGRHHVEIADLEAHLDFAAASISRVTSNIFSRMSGRDARIYDRMDRLLVSRDGYLPLIFAEQNQNRVAHATSSSPAILSVGPARFPGRVLVNLFHAFEQNEIQVHNLGYHTGIETWEKLRKQTVKQSLAMVLKEAQQSQIIYEGDRPIGRRPACVGYGSSAGSLMLLLAAIRRPELFSALVLTSTPIRITNVEINRILKNAYREACLNHSLRAGVRSGNLGPLDRFSPADQKPPANVPYLETLPARPLMELRYLQTEIMRNIDKLDPDIKVIFIHGEEDGFCHARAVSSLMKRMPSRHLELITLPSGHLLDFWNKKSGLQDRVNSSLAALLMQAD